MPGKSHRRQRPSLEEAADEPIQLVDSTEGLDEFAPESERSLLRIEPPGAPAPKTEAIPDPISATDVWPDLPRLAWTPHASRVALAGSVVIAVIGGSLLLRPTETLPPTVDPSEPIIASAIPTTAYQAPVLPVAVWTAPSEPRSVEAAPTEGSRLPARPPERLVAINPPNEPRAIPVESATAVAGSASLPTALPTPGPPPVVTGPRITEPSPAETFRAAAAEVPVDAPRPTTRELDARAIDNVLGQYRNAFNTLDASAAVAVWPTVNEKTLARAFERLDEQDVSFESCSIEVGGVHAEATCSGTARYVPKVGSRTPRDEARRWKFLLRRTSDGWRIDRIDAR